MSEEQQLPFSIGQQLIPRLVPRKLCVCIDNLGTKDPFHWVVINAREIEKIIKPRQIFSESKSK